MDHALAISAVVYAVSVAAMLIYWVDIFDWAGLDHGNPNDWWTLGLPMLLWPFFVVAVIVLGVVTFLITLPGKKGQK